MRLLTAANLRLPLVFLLMSRNLKRTCHREPHQLFSLQPKNFSAFLSDVC